MFGNAPQGSAVTMGIEGVTLAREAFPYGYGISDTRRPSDGKDCP
jgi:hypothetical protein